MRFKLVESFNFSEDVLNEVDLYTKNKIKNRVSGPTPNIPKKSGQGKRWKTNNFQNYLADNFNIPANLLQDNYVLHHIDGDDSNDDPSNLAVIPKNLHDCLGISWTTVQRVIGEKFRKIPVNISGKEGYMTLILHDSDVSAMIEKNPPGKIMTLLNILKRFIPFK